MHWLAFMLTPLKQACLPLSLDQNLRHMQKKVIPTEQLENQCQKVYLWYLTFDSSRISHIPQLHWVKPCMQKQWHTVSNSRSFKIDFKRFIFHLLRSKSVDGLADFLFVRLDFTQANGQANQNPWTKRVCLLYLPGCVTLFNVDQQNLHFHIIAPITWW